MIQSQRKPSFWSVAWVPVGLAAVMTPAILLAAGGAGSSGGFDEVVHSIEQHYHVHATRIPFMGLISFVAGRSTHGGVRGLHVAEIEHFEGPVDGEELTTLVQQHAGSGWQRMVRETSRDGGEQSLIYVRPEGDHLGMLIVERDTHEMNIVQLSMNPDKLSDEIGKHHHGAGHDTEKPDGDRPESGKSGNDAEDSGGSE
jgi:hypothetical protein